MPYKAYTIYLDGEPFRTLTAALRFAHRVSGRAVSRDELSRAAVAGAVLEGPLAAVAVSFKAPDRKGKPVPGETAGEKEKPPPVPAPERLLLRYPPGEGPLYSGSRVWI